MKELEEINRRARPANILLIVDAMIGQDAVATAKAFNQRLDLDGVILTKLDGDARGGAAEAEYQALEPGGVRDAKFDDQRVVGAFCDGLVRGWKEGGADGV